MSNVVEMLDKPTGERSARALRLSMKASAILCAVLAGGYVWLKNRSAGADWYLLPLFGIAVAEVITCVIGLVLAMIGIVQKGGQRRMAPFAVVVCLMLLG